MSKILLIIVVIVTLITSAQTHELDKETEGKTMINIRIGENILKAELVDNSSTTALMKLLHEGPVTINMKDYGKMEKVGLLEKNLPTNDQNIDAVAGDLILYQGRQFVLYYDKNSWSFTKLGHIVDVSTKELRMLLGEGDVEITLFVD